MAACRYCRREIGPDARTCEDCTDYETAARVAARVVQCSEIESGFLAAAVGAEIVREFLLRSPGGARARDHHLSLHEMQALNKRPLL